MHVVIDSSVLVGALIDIRGETGARYRSRLVELVGVDQAYVLRTLTKLEVTAALRRLLVTGPGTAGPGTIGETDCEGVIKEMHGWPFTRVDLTQPMLNRIWELRTNITAYDAAYVAATEHLMAHTGGNAMLATADGKLARSSILGVPVELFTPSA